MPLEEEKAESSLANIGKRVVSVKKTFESVKIPKNLNSGIFMRLKRILAGLLLVIYLITSVLVFPHPFIVFFLGTALIMLDYILKTRKSLWVEA